MEGRAHGVTLSVRRHSRNRTKVLAPSIGVLVRLKSVGMVLMADIPGGAHAVAMTSGTRLHGSCPRWTARDGCPELIVAREADPFRTADPRAPTLFDGE